MFPPELPSITNKPLYVYRVLAKWISFFVFGLSTLILAVIIFPFMRLAFFSGERFKKSGRILVYFSMRCFVSFMRFLGIVDIKTDNRESYRHLSSKIIVANHPSLLDIVMLFSLVPNADCIVNTNLNRNFIVRGVIRQLYILNSLDLEDLFNACTESLKQGNCLIIFPEGTRTPRYGKTVIKRGAARAALISGCNIVPVRIEGTDKYLPVPRAVRAMTREIAAFLFPVKDEK